MLKLRTPREGTTRARRFGRSTRSIAAIITTSLLAPAAIASVATTVATTISASPAAASAPRVYVVAGDDPSRTGAGSGAWGFHGVDYSQLRGIITNPSFFGPTGTVNAQFKIGSPIATISDATLAGVDVFFSGAIQGASGSSQSYSPAEQLALQNFVKRGGVVIINQNSPTWASGEAFNVTEQDPEAVFEADTDHAGVGGGFEAPNASGGAGAATAVASTPLVTGPFGTVTSYSMYHTVAGFTSLPANAVVNARITTPTCVPQQISCKNPPSPPISGTTTTSTTIVADPNPRPNYTNAIANLPALATVAPGNPNTLTGAIIVTSDVDTYSNHYLADGSDQPVGGGTMTASNELLAKNSFAWIAGVLNAQNPAEGYTPVSPTRILDTRSTGKLGPSGTIDLQVGGITAGSTAIPSNITGVVLNVTADQPDAIESYLTVYPTAATPNTPPDSSNLNFRAGVTIPNMVMVKVGIGGKVSMFNKSGSVNVLVDIVGYFQASSGSRLNSTAPSRVLSTRDGIGSTATPISAGESREVQITGGAVPAGSTAVVLNLTATEETTGGYATVYPADLTSVPNTSNLNFGVNQNIANLAIVPLPTSGVSAGKVKVFNASGTAHIIADVLGYFGPTGGSFAPINPSRVLDTRTGVGGVTGKVGANSTIEFTVLGVGGVPTEGVRTVVLNVTAAEPTVGGYLTVFPNDKPNASNLNFVANQVIPNLVVAQVNSAGKVKVYNEQGQTHVLADVVAWFN